MDRIARMMDRTARIYKPKMSREAFKYLEENDIIDHTLAKI
ncbi:MULTISPECIES: hypothetical protein [unclassified Lysinibacillus]